MAELTLLNDLLILLDKAGQEMLQYCRALDPEQFYAAPAEKWNTAEQLKHLTISANATRTAYKLPKFILRLYTGKPNRPSRSYEEVKGKYYAKLEAGGRASKRFIPAPASQADDMKVILAAFEKSMDKLQTTIRRNWKDEDLDHYLAPHPLLGKITLRELIYFTIFHTEHHQETIEKLRVKI